MPRQPAKVHDPRVEGLPANWLADLCCAANVVREILDKVTHEGKDYYLCFPSCAEEFKADPKKYAK
ncbi:MAG: hypothetical protein QM784_09250 [Polyangiaceae bacterium]